jgi:aminoglycoside phosphotransferase family enzyme
MSTSLTPLLSSLLQPEAYPHPVSTVRLVETHVSWVFLTGAFAYKIKRRSA